jgi:hypothetical protein
MKSMKYAFAVALLAVGAASAASHSVVLSSTQWAGDKQLKPGVYKVEITGDKAVLKSGKTVIDVPATVQTADKKFSHTTFQSVDSKLTEIDLGGTNTKIVFGAAGAGAAAGGK